MNFYIYFIIIEYEFCSIFKLFTMLQGICYVTHSDYIQSAKQEWERKSNNAIVDYMVVSRLPRDAKIEWHVWAHRGNSRFQCK